MPRISCRYIRRHLGLLLCGAVPLLAQASACLPVASLIERDARYEDAMRSGDAAYLDELLAPGYIWVHSLASATDSKADVLGRARASSAAAKPQYKSRSTSAVEAQVLGDTVVLRGLSTVEQWNPDFTTWRSNRYQFMRTYVAVEGACRLLAVQTMKVWSSEPPTKAR